MPLQHAGAAADRAPHSVFAWLDIIAMLHIYAQDGMRSRRALKCWGRCAQQMHRAVQWGGIGALRQCSRGGGGGELEPSNVYRCVTSRPHTNRIETTSISCAPHGITAVSGSELNQTF